MIILHRILLCISINKRKEEEIMVDVGGVILLGAVIFLVVALNYYLFK